MAKNEQLPILEYLGYPDVAVAAILRSYDLYGSEPDGKDGTRKNKSKQYRALMSDIVDLINLCNQKIEQYKGAPDDYDLYSVSGKKMYDEFILKRDALTKLFPVLKKRFADNYNEKEFLAEINSITNEGFPSSRYRRMSATRSNRELFDEIVKIYNNREDPQDAYNRQLFQSNKETAYFDARREIDPCSRLMKSLEWFAKGGAIKYGHEYIEKNGEKRYAYTSEAEYLSLSEPKIIYKIMQAIAAITQKCIQNESEFYQREDESERFFELPSLPQNWDDTFDYIIDSINDLLHNESFKQSYEYQEILKLLSHYVEDYKRIKNRNEHPQKNNDIIPLDEAYTTKRGRTK